MRDDPDFCLEAAGALSYLKFYNMLEKGKMFLTNAEAWQQ